MKIVKENIFEKFEESSDPIKDMGIGWQKKLQELYDIVNEYMFDNKVKTANQLFIKCCRMSHYRSFSGEKTKKLHLGIYQLLENEKISQSAKNNGLAFICESDDIDFKLVETLVNKGANPSHNFSKCLDNATRNYNPNIKVIEYLVENGANPEHNSGEAMKTAVHLQHYDILKYFLTVIDKKTK